MSLILCYIIAHRPMCHSSFVISEHIDQCVTHPLLYQSTQANVSLILCYVRAHRPMCHSSLVISEHTGQCVTHPLLCQSTQANVSLILCYIIAHRPMCHSSFVISEHTGQCVTHPLLYHSTQANVSLILCYIRAHRPMCRSSFVVIISDSKELFRLIFWHIEYEQRNNCCKWIPFKVLDQCDLLFYMMIVLPNHIILPIFVQISQHFRTFYYITSTSI